MFGKFLTIAFCFSLSACAKPNYQDSKDLKVSQKVGLSCSSISNLCHRLTWETMPTETTMGSFKLEFFQSNLDSPWRDLPGDLSVVLWMPSMGHGSSPVQIEKVAPGIYHVTRVFFVMPGEWEIRVQLKNGNSVVDEIIQNISI